MKLIVGLGNPEKKYDLTRHNAGFMALDYFSIEENIDFKLDNKLKGFIGQKNINGEKVIILKPITYMNLSGDSIRLVLDYYKIDIKDMIVLVDDISLDLSKIRIREKGSSGGHNGLKSIEANLSTNQYNRVRIGVGNNTLYDLKDYVLSKFNNEEKPILIETIKKIYEILKLFIKNTDLRTIMNKYNQ